MVQARWAPCASFCDTTLIKSQTPSDDSTYCFVEEDNKVLFPANSTGNDASSSDGVPVS